MKCATIKLSSTTITTTRITITIIFKKPQPPTKENRSAKRMAKKSMVGLDEDDKDEITDIRADRSEDSFLGKIMQHFNNGREHLIHRFTRRGNEPDLHDVKIVSLKQQIQELNFPQLQQDSPAEEAETEFHDDHYDNPLLTKKTESEPIIWDIRDEEEEYPFVNKYPSFQEESIMLVEQNSFPVYDTDNEEEELMPVYDTDIEDVIEEEEIFVGK
ncbi:hypothetical protein Tco_1014065 [Tanacetum coccineum]